MKFLTIILTLLITGGCVSYKTVQLPPEQLHKQISSGKIVSEGDKVKMVTSDGKEHEFQVKAITGTHITGGGTNLPKVSIPIKDVIQLKRGKISAAKSGLVGYNFYLLFFLFLL